MVYHINRDSLVLVCPKLYHSNIHILTNEKLINSLTQKIFNFSRETNKDGCNVTGWKVLTFVRS